MSAPARLSSIQVGTVRMQGTPGAADPLEREWKTAYYKDPVTGPVRVGRLGLAGDHQYSDDHGGPHVAVLSYSADHYPQWRQELGIPEMGPGGFGENFTVTGLEEGTVCIGDVLAVGEARLQVASPRGPCNAIARRWKNPHMVKLVTANGRSGWYSRVLEEGNATAGDEVKLIDRPFPQWSVARVFRLKVEPQLSPEDVMALATCELLAPEWRKKFVKHAGSGQPS